MATSVPGSGACRFRRAAPALVGLLLLGDQARPGWGWVAAVGFVLSVAGAVSLARHGEIEPAPSPSA